MPSPSSALGAPPSERNTSERNDGVFLVAADEDLRVLVRITLRPEPRLRVTAEAATAVAALSSITAAETAPALIIVDRHLTGDRTGVQAAADFESAAPDAKILLLTARAPDREAEASTSIHHILRKSELHLLVDAARRLLDLPSEG